MHLNILSPDKIVFAGEASAVQLPGSKGSFEVLNNHAPLISSLEKGKIRIRKDKEEKIFKISSGFVEVLQNKITVLIESLVSED